jgi:hypothetical protein
MGKMKKSRLEEDYFWIWRRGVLFISYAVSCHACAGMVVQNTQGVFKSASRRVK